jgi:Tfp pilus assembly protein PilO
VSRRNSMLIAVVAVVAAIGAYWMLVLSPKREEAVKLDGQITKQQSALATAEADVATYEAAQKHYKANYSMVARLGKAVPADDDVRSLLVQLEAAADRTGVDFRQIELGGTLAGTQSQASSSSTTATPSPGTGDLASAPGAIPVAGGALSALPFNFTFTGGFFDLSTFFAKLEHFVTVNNQQLDATGRLLRLESVSITPGTAGFPAMQASIGAAAYIVPPVEGVNGATGTPSAAQNASTTPSTPASPGSTTTTATAGAAQ